jgi:hypothetical protein
VDDVGELRQAEYCILELSEDTLEEHGDIEDEYPSLEHNDREDLLTLLQQLGFLLRTRNPIRPNSE